MKPFREMAGLPAPGEELGGWSMYKPDYDYRKDSADCARAERFDNGCRRWLGSRRSRATRPRAKRCCASIARTRSRCHPEQTRRGDEGRGQGPIADRLEHFLPGSDPHIATPSVPDLMPNSGCIAPCFLFLNKPAGLTQSFPETAPGVIPSARKKAPPAGDAFGDTLTSWLTCRRR